MLEFDDPDEPRTLLELRQPCNARGGARTFSPGSVEGGLRRTRHDAGESPSDGGRFNGKGVPALYTSLSPHAAIREANQVGTLQPTILVAFEADITDVFDTRPSAALATRGMSAAEIAADDWRERMRDDSIAPTQRFAAELTTDSFSGLLVPSFARGARDTDRNLVLFRWGEGTAARLTLIDDEGRLR